MDFTNYSTRSRFAKEINAGYSARLNDGQWWDNPHLVWHDQPEGGLAKQIGHFTEMAEAWQHGWRLADQGEKGAR